MKPTERRAQILRLLRHSRKALTGRYFSEKFGISRQVIVGDIMALRAAGEPIVASPEGYRYQLDHHEVSAVFKCRHTNEQTQEELNLIVDLGGSVEDVMVRHRIYGELSAQLSIHSREDAAVFMQEIREGKSTPLMNVTSGYHYHTVSAADEETLASIQNALRARGFLVEG